MPCAAHTPETPGLVPKPYEQSCGQCPTGGQSPKRDPGLAAPLDKAGATVAARRPAHPSASASAPPEVGKAPIGKTPISLLIEAMPEPKFWSQVQMIHRGCTTPHVSAVTFVSL